MRRLHVFIGTKAQYIKTAPLLRLMDERGVDYRLIDSGQHAALTGVMRTELGVRTPDLLLGGSADITSVPAALAWSARLSARLWSASRLRSDVFGGAGGICVVHGDTPSTLWSCLMARRAGLAVAHLEAGLRSHNLLNPFPEELVRLAVMRLSSVLFAPDALAVANLAAMRGLSGDVVPVSGNTVMEALRRSLAGAPIAGSGAVVVTTHRVENLHSRTRMTMLLDVVDRVLAFGYRVAFVQHGPTTPALERLGLNDRLRSTAVEQLSLLPHAAFTRLLAAAPFVITDGGSIQEECALLGVPTLLWRSHTERPDGLGANVVLSAYDDNVVSAFLADPSAWRRPPADTSATPSEQILAELQRRLAAMS